MSPWKGASFKSQGGKQEAAEAFNVTVQEGYHCDRNYVLKVYKQAKKTPTELLVIAELQPKEGSLPSFSFRWDEKDDSLDVDIQGVTGIVESWFNKGIKGYAGHHPKRVTSQRRTFEADIRIPQIHVFHGCLSFNLGRNVEAKVSVGVSANASVDTPQK